MNQLPNRKVVIMPQNADAFVANVSIEEESQSFCFDGVVFGALIDSSEEDNFGFYDWLRTSSNEIVGLRLRFFEKIPFWFNNLNLTHASVDEGRLTVEMIFDSSRDIDEGISEDQILGDVWLFEGNDGSVALALC